MEEKSGTPKVLQEQGASSNNLADKCGSMPLEQQSLSFAKKSRLSQLTGSSKLKVCHQKTKSQQELGYIKLNRNRNNELSFCEQSQTSFKEPADIPPKKRENNENEDPYPNYYSLAQSSGQAKSQTEAKPILRAKKPNLQLQKQQNLLVKKIFNL